MYMVRGTELQDFLRCRLAWKFRWIDGLQPKKPNNKLLFGTLFHKFLEVLYTSQSYDAAIDAMLDLRDKTDVSSMDEMEYQEMMRLLEQTTTNYSRQYVHEDANWGVIATELTFAIPLDDEIGYTGTIDLIVRDKSDGKIYLVDHKTTNSIEKYDKNSDMDRQISRYWWALEQLFSGNGQYSYDKEIWHDAKNFQLALDSTEIGGFIYNIILKDYPVPPKVLKNGSLSKDKSQRTTYEMYRKALEEHGIWKHQTGTWPPSEYEDILVHLSQNPKEFFRRIRVTRTQSEIDASMNELYMTAMDMHPIFGSTPLIYRNITKECPWCPFQPICKASMDGSNVEYLTESLYTVESTER